MNWRVFYAILRQQKSSKAAYSTVKFGIRLAFVLYGLAQTGPALAITQVFRNPYAFCTNRQEVPEAPVDEEQTHAPGETVIWADKTKALEGGISSLIGNVELRRDEQALRADTVTWDQPRDIVNVTGHVKFWDPNLFWSGERGYMYLGDDKAYLEHGQYQLRNRRGSGNADYATNDRSDQESYLERVDFTTCEKPNPSWQLAAKILKLHHAADTGEAKDVVLRFHDVPVFYWPYMTFPLSQKRKSGFLTPLFGYRTRTGADITIPYYWNIAPNQDATLSARILGERGVMLGAQYRYLLRSGLGEFTVHYLPNDAKFGGNNRHLLSFKHDGTLFDRRANLNLVFNDVSDKSYFQDFGTNLVSTSTRILERRADLSTSGTYFQKNSWSLLARVQNYQNIDPTLISPFIAYTRLPQVVFSTLLPDLYKNLYLQVDAEGTYFDRSSDSVIGVSTPSSPLFNVTGSRLNFKSTLGFPLRSRYGFLEPRVSLQHTSYFLTVDELPGANGQRFSSVAPDQTLTRTLPIASLDSGLFFERDLQLGGNAYTHTIEPRLFYLYIPYHDQNPQPLFDTGLYDISFAGLFRENRFNGIDRIGDANQVTMALTSRLIGSDSGWERLRVSVGQTFYFNDRQVALRSNLQPQLAVTSIFQPDPNQDLSETIAEVGARFTREWSGRANVTWNPTSGVARKETLGLRYWGDNGLIVNAEYRRRRDFAGRGAAGVQIEQTDISARVPVSPNLALIGRWLYSIPQQITLEGLAGFEYDSCCWAMRLVARRYILGRYLNSGQALSGEQLDTGFFLQIELKGLAGAGRNTLNFLRNSIPGYPTEW